MAIKNKVLIIGCGRLGSSIANHFSSKGENIVVVDETAISFERLDANFSGYKVQGDASDLAFLEKHAYLDSTYKVAICTGDDNLNLFLAHAFDKIYEIDRIYVRFNDPDKSYLISGEANVQGIYPFVESFDRFVELDGGEDEEA